MASRRDMQQEDVHYRVLRLLDQNPELSVREIASIVGVSNGSAFYCLNALVEKGMIKLGSFGASKHKGRYAYVLTPMGMAEKAALTVRFFRRKLDEYESLRREIELLRMEVGDEVSDRQVNLKFGISDSVSS